jgi:hypothetical protein
MEAIEKKKQKNKKQKLNLKKQNNKGQKQHPIQHGGAEMGF